MSVSFSDMGTAKHEAFEALRQFVIAERTRQRMSQRELAKASGVSPATVAHIEAGRGHIPKQETLEGIAKGLGVSYETLDHIVRGVPEPDPSTPPDLRIDEMIRVFNKLPEELRDWLIEGWQAQLDALQRQAAKRRQ